eukprot:m.258796 g.258796  ORF g.258796 m.258796 type:complete len:412 (+) comp16197_c1_seq9:91-1326(+)
MLMILLIQSLVVSVIGYTSQVILDDCSDSVDFRLSNTTTTSKIFFDSESCLFPATQYENWTITIIDRNCSTNHPNWEFRQTKGDGLIHNSATFQIIHKVTGLCLSGSEGFVKIEDCSDTIEQLWNITFKKNGYAMFRLVGTNSCLAPGRHSRCINVVCEHCKYNCVKHCLMSETMGGGPTCKFAPGRTYVYPKGVSFNQLIFDGNGMIKEKSFSGVKVNKLQIMGGSRVVFEPGAFDGMSTINTLILPYLGLKQLNASFFAGLNFTEGSLDLSRNNLKEVPDFPDVGNLVTLLLSCNQITLIEPEKFVFLTALRHLELGGNYIRYLPPKAFMMKSLVNVALTGNPIQQIDPGAFPGMSTALYTHFVLFIVALRLGQFYRNQQLFQRRCHRWSIASVSATVTLSQTFILDPL